MEVENEGVVVRRVKLAGVLVFCATSAAIAVNAMFLQPGSHPAPFGKRLAKASDAGARAKPRRIAARAPKISRNIPAPVKPKPKPAAKPALDRAALRARLNTASITKAKAAKPSKDRGVGTPPDDAAPPAKSAQPQTPAALPENAPATIRLVQIGLAELGYNPGPVDGALGRQTEIAIREFEVHRDLPITGKVSQRLIDELRKVTGSSVMSVL